MPQGRRARLSKFHSFLITRDLSINQFRTGWYFRWRKNWFRFIYQALLNPLSGRSIPWEISAATTPSNNRWKIFSLLWVLGATTLNSRVSLLHRLSPRQQTPNMRISPLDREQSHKTFKMHLVLLELPWVPRLALSLSSITIKGQPSLLRSLSFLLHLRYMGRSSTKNKKSDSRERVKYSLIRKRRRSILLSSEGMPDT